MLLEIDHVGVVARTIDEALETLVGHLGLVVDEARSPMPKGVWFPPEQTWNYFFKVGNGKTRVEVLIPEGTTSGTARFLARNGPGLHHIGYASDNVYADAKRLEESGLRRIDIGPTDDPAKVRAAFFHPKAMGGILTELVPLYAEPYHAG